MFKKVREKIVNWLLKDVEIRPKSIKVGESTITLGTDADFGGGQLINAILEKLTADPTLAEARIWFRTDLDRIRYSPDGTVAKSTAYIPVPRADLEYPTADVTCVYLLAIDKLQRIQIEATDGWGLGTVDNFTDKAVENVMVQDEADFNIGRLSDYDNFYMNYIWTGATTQDFRCYKRVTGSWTILGSEAVDLTHPRYLLKLSISGSTLDNYREDMSTPKFSVTDTDLASGVYGGGTRSGYSQSIVQLTWILRASSSPTPRASATFEVPIIGSGTNEDPFRPQIPQEIVEDPKLGKRNKMALTHSSLVPVNEATGKPVNASALIRIFEQPDRNSALYSISKCLGALREIAGVRKLTVDEAKSLAKKLDDRLRSNEIEYMFNPTPINKLASLADFYTRECVDEGGVNPEEILDFDTLMQSYAEKAERLGRIEVSKIFRKIKKQA